MTAAVAYLGISFALVATETMLAQRGSFNTAPRARLSDQMMILGTTATLLTGLASAALGLATIGPRWAVLSLGIALGLFGAALRATAMSTLGRLYSLTPQVVAEQAIVSSGPYRLIRHPGYAGILLSLVGLQLIAGTWVGLISLAFVVIPLPVRIRIEEELLLQTLATSYQNYEERTPYRLLPGIY